MANVALFVTPQFIKENTAIDGNVDDKYVAITIEDCQKMHIRPILGTALYDEIAAQILANTVTSANQALLNNYIQDALKYWILVEGIDLFIYKITNKSISKKNSDNSQPIEDLEVIRLMDRNKDKAEFFSQACTNFLVSNTSTYPLYLNPGNSYDTVIPNKNNYTTGWELGGSDKTYRLPIAPSKFDI